MPPTDIPTCNLAKPPATQKGVPLSSGPSPIYFENSDCNLQLCVVPTVLNQALNKSTHRLYPTYLSPPMPPTLT